MAGTPDQEHINLLSIFHYVVGGVVALFSLFPIFHLAMGLFILFAPESMDSGNEPVTALVAWVFIGTAVSIIIFGLIFASLIIATGRCLAKRKHYTFCMVIAGLECLFFPFGTVLGIFTIIVLMRESVKPLFQGNLPLTES